MQALITSKLHSRPQATIKETLERGAVSLLCPISRLVILIQGHQLDCSIKIFLEDHLFQHCYF